MEVKEWKDVLVQLCKVQNAVVLGDKSSSDPALCFDARTTARFLCEVLVQRSLLVGDGVAQHNFEYRRKQTLDRVPELRRKKSELLKHNREQLFLLSKATDQHLILLDFFHDGTTEHIATFFRSLMLQSTPGHPTRVTETGWTTEVLFQKVEAVCMATDHKAMEELTAGLFTTGSVDAILTVTCVALSKTPAELTAFLSTVTRTCQKCGRLVDKPASRCGKCHSAFYCSRDCQFRDWPRHKPVCSS